MSMIKAPISIKEIFKNVLNIKKLERITLVWKRVGYFVINSS